MTDFSTNASSFLAYTPHVMVAFLTLATGAVMIDVLRWGVLNRRLLWNWFRGRQ